MALSIADRTKPHTATVASAIPDWLSWDVHSILAHVDVACLEMVASAAPRMSFPLCHYAHGWYFIHE